MSRAIIAVLGLVVLVGGAFAIFGLTAAASPSARSPVVAVDRGTTAANQPGSGQSSSGTDADCNGDQHGKPNGDSSHQFPPGSVPGHKNCSPPPAVPEVPVASGLFALLLLVGLGFLVKTGHVRLPFARTT